MNPLGLQDYVLVVLGSVYICASEAREDKEILCCARPSASTNFCLRLIWEIVFSLHYILFPTFILMSAVALVATSSDAVDIILNVLSVVF